MSDEYSIVIDDVSVCPVGEVKILGVTLDRHFTFAKHIEDVAAKCHGLLGMLRRSSSYLPRDLLKLVYTSLIRTHLEYASAVFASAAPIHLKKLDVIQKIASRVITGSHPRTHSAPLQALLGLESLEARRSRHIASIVKDISEGTSHPYFENFFNEVGVPLKSATLCLEKRRFRNFGPRICKEHVEGVSNIPQLQRTSVGRSISHFPTPMPSPHQHLHSQAFQSVAVDVAAPFLHGV